MDLANFPLEVLEMIVANISFVDLPYFIQASKTTQTIFERTTFHTSIDFVREHNLRELHKHMTKFPKMWGVWSTSNVLKAYTDPRCLECGDFGFFLMYVNVPPIKLCAHCILLCPKYGHVKVEDGVKYYGLELRDIEYLPIVDVVKKPHREGTHEHKAFEIVRTILRNTLISVATSQGVSLPMEDFVGENLVAHKSFGPEDMPRYYCGFIGCVKVLGSFAHKRGYRFGEMYCGHCEPHEMDYKGKEACFQEIYWNGWKLIRAIPQSYDSLYSHIAQRHKDILPYFLSGWQALPTYFKSVWLNPHSKNSFNRYTTTYQVWTSWHEAAYFQLKSDHPYLEGDDFRKELGRWAAHQLDHSASAFGLPLVPDEARAPQVGYQFSDGYLTRGRAAGRFVNIILDRALIEARDWLMAKIQGEGFISLHPILEGESLFKLIAEHKAAEEEEE